MADEATHQETVAPVSTIAEERQKRYTRWKKNSKLYYDYLNTNSTKWPSLTCQLFPDLDLATDEHRILLSSFTSSQVPEDESLYVARLSSMKHIPWSSLNNFDMEEKEFKVDNSLKLPSKSLVEDLRIKFPAGDCNKARYCPSNPDLIGSASSNGSIYVFDRTKHGFARQKLISAGDTDHQVHCQLSTSLEEHKNEAVSLAWNWQRQGLLATSYSHGQVCVWDLEKYDKNSPTLINPLAMSTVDPRGSNEVSWMVRHDSLLAYCSEDNLVGIMDIRNPEKDQSSGSNPHHSNGINTCQFNYHRDMLLCSADSAGRINLWDIRNFTQPLKTLLHNDSISVLQWNPHEPTVLATGGQDGGLVKIWDLSQPEGQELIFTHGGHMLGVNDISWDPHDTWMMCSVANDNSIQVWRSSNSLVEPK
ncbi:MSI1-like protein [Lachancea thermotolerans]